MSPRKHPNPSLRRAPQLFPPLRLNRVVNVQPLLTPDNYAENALKLIQSAQKSVWFQNQYINFRGTSDDFAEFRCWSERSRTRSTRRSTCASSAAT